MKSVGVMIGWNENLHTLSPPWQRLDIPGLSATRERGRIEQDTGAEGLQEYRESRIAKRAELQNSTERENALVGLVKVIFLKLPNQSVN